MVKDIITIILVTIVFGPKEAILFASNLFVALFTGVNEGLKNASKQRKQT